MPFVLRIISRLAPRNATHSFIPFIISLCALLLVIDMFKPPGAAGGVPYAVSILLSITALLTMHDKKVANQLSVSKQRYELAVRAARIGMWEWNLNTHELYLTSPLQEMVPLSHYPPQDMTDWIRRIHTDDQAPTMLALRAHLDGRTEEYLAEYRIPCQDGSVGWFLDRGIAVRDANDRPVYMRGAITDITERKRGEIELKMAKKAAEAASDAKSRFLANVTHEIRTPLNAVLGFTDILLSGAGQIDELERQDYLKTIRLSAAHLLELINDILDLSRIDAGQLATERIRCSPHEVIAEVVSMMRVRAQEKGLVLQSERRGDAPATILSDPSRLRQLLVNLVGNAIKFTKTGSVRVVTSCIEAGGKQRLSIEVIDTGIGIPEDQLEKIFDPFVQADRSIARRFGGTGLGLAICQSIAEALGGRITVSSQVGEGSVFRVEIDPGPVEAAETVQAAAEPLTPKPPPANEARTPRPLRGRVLLVDDCATNRRLEGLVLRRAGVEVVEAHTGSAAVDLAARYQFDLILMDLQMPVMDGYEATRLLRKQGLTTPIIALTAQAGGVDKQPGDSAGWTGYLTKPIEPDRLLHAVAEVLTSAKQPSAEQDSSSPDVASNGHSFPQTAPPDELEAQDARRRFPTACFQD